MNSHNSNRSIPHDSSDDGLDPMLLGMVEDLVNSHNRMGEASRRMGSGDSREDGSRDSSSTTEDMNEIYTIQEDNTSSTGEFSGAVDNNDKDSVLNFEDEEATETARQAILSAMRSKTREGTALARDVNADIIMKDYDNDEVHETAARDKLPPTTMRGETSRGANKCRQISKGIIASQNMTKYKRPEEFGVDSDSTPSDIERAQWRDLPENLTLADKVKVNIKGIHDALESAKKFYVGTCLECRDFVDSNLHDIVNVLMDLSVSDLDHNRDRFGCTDLDYVEKCIRFSLQLINADLRMNSPKINVKCRTLDALVLILNHENMYYNESPYDVLVEKIMVFQRINGFKNLSIYLNARSGTECFPDWHLVHLALEATRQGIHNLQHKQDVEVSFESLDNFCKVVMNMVEGIVIHMCRMKSEDMARIDVVVLSDTVLFMNSLSKTLTIVDPKARAKHLTFCQDITVTLFSTGSKEHIEFGNEMLHTLLQSIRHEDDVLKEDFAKWFLEKDIVKLAMGDDVFDESIDVSATPSSIAKLVKAIEFLEADITCNRVANLLSFALPTQTTSSSSKGAAVEQVTSRSDTFSPPLSFDDLPSAIEAAKLALESAKRWHAITFEMLNSAQKENSTAGGMVERARDYLASIEKNGSPNELDPMLTHEKNDSCKDLTPKEHRENLLNLKKLEKGKSSHDVTKMDFFSYYASNEREKSVRNISKSKSFKHNIELEKNISPTSVQTQHSRIKKKQKS